MPKKLEHDTPVLIIGAGGHGRVILDTLMSGGRKVVGFLDDNVALHGTEVNGVPVLGASANAAEIAHSLAAAVIIGIGEDSIRAKMMNLLLESNIALACAIHSSAVIAKDVVVPPGVVVMAGAVINTGVQLGLGSVVNTKASLDHDVILGEGAHVMPGAVGTGGVAIGRYAVLGSGAVILPYRHVGDNAYVAAGAVVVENVPVDAIVMGVPAKFSKWRDPLIF